MKSLISISVFSFVLLSLTVSTLKGQVSEWRGPGRTGSYKETGLLKAWPESGPRLLWETTGHGKGYGSIISTPDAVYITGTHGNAEFLTSFSQDGKKRWDVEFGTIGKSTYPESRCTPTFYNNKLYVINGLGELYCITKDGKVVWKTSYYQIYQASVPRFGISESPLVVDNKVIVTPGGPKAAMVAFNAENGKMVWETPSLNEGSMYVNPLLIDDKGVKTIVTHTPTYIIGVDPGTGKIRWKFNFASVNNDGQGGKNYINTPLYRDGELFAANGYGQTSAKIKINSGGTDPTLLWKNPDFNPHVGGMVLLGNYIYGSTHDSNSKGRWICLDWSTGKTAWITEWNNKGSVIAADGMLIIYDEKFGNVALVKPDPEKLNIVSSFKIVKGDGPHWAHPVVEKGRLFVRHGDYLAVYSLKAE